MKKTKKLISMLLVFAVMLSVCSLTTLAADETKTRDSTEVETTIIKPLPQPVALMAVAPSGLSTEYAGPGQVIVRWNMTGAILMYLAQRYPGAHGYVLVVQTIIGTYCTYMGSVMGAAGPYSDIISMSIIGIYY
ncbi:MAG: hypothetical protein LBN02_09980 [Oscillospiraceae bacterium]|jgi:hypothetical protein|nr:hypothetical protein [Oscillospiraceae bacterium]